MNHRRTEITWSLMHPTPLDDSYMLRVVERARAYRVDSFEICAECHSPLGGLNGLILYEKFPHAAARLDRAAVLANRAALRRVLGAARASGRPVYYWHREVMVPEGLLEDCPGLLDADGEFDLLGEAYSALLRYKIDRAFEAVPELDGLVLTLTEADYSVIHNSNTTKYPPVQVVAHIVRIFAGELKARGKHFVLRSFGSIAQDYEDIIAGGVEAARTAGFEIETKITPYDFDPFLPENPFLRPLPGVTLGAECDGLGEFLGAGFLPAENVENIVRYVRQGQKAGVSRFAIRLDRVGNTIFDGCEINLYAYARAIDDPEATAEMIRTEWLARHAPASAAAAFARLGKEGLELVLKNNFIDGNVIFHQFPIGYELKMVKAGYIFALFKEHIDLHLGSGVWSILSQNRPPGRSAILAEKDAACKLAESGSALLASLPREPGWETEYAWRERLWRNARIVTRAFRAFVRCVCAYFDDMERGDAEARSLHAAMLDARREYQELAGTALEPPKTRWTFCNGMDHKVLRVAKNLNEAYLKPLAALTALLGEEYSAEFAARRNYRPGTLDCVICGGIADDWRCGRDMHASHACLYGGSPARIAGNRVFPNGFVELELSRPARGGELVIHGIAGGPAFFATIDGRRFRGAFDAEGRCVLPLSPGTGVVRLRLEKAESAYPMFRAVTVRDGSEPQNPDGKK